MPIDRPSRSALIPAAGSAVTTRGDKYTTTWNHRDGYVTTSDPRIAGIMAIGVACLGLAALVEAFWQPPQLYSCET